MPTRSSDRPAAAALEACRALLRGGSHTFHRASYLLPRDVRDHACAVYAFCRLADDAVDCASPGPDAVVDLRARLDRIYAGRPLNEGADIAFAHVVQRFAIPRTLPQALLEGFEWDAEGRRYPVLSALHAYSARVAGSVGAMMALLMGVRSPEALARACDLGVAMQLTNIVRDVGEDARAGRLYLPLAWLRENGIDPDAWLARPAFDGALAAVVQRVLDAADDLYERASGGIALLPLTCRPAIHAARVLYAEIGREVERNHLDSVSRRAVVGKRRKAWAMTRALGGAARGAVAVPVPALDETRFLVESVVEAPAPHATDRLAWWNVRGRLIRVIELFERLERREQLRRQTAA